LISVSGSLYPKDNTFSLIYSTSFVRKSSISQYLDLPGTYFSIVALSQMLGCMISLPQSVPINCIRSLGVRISDCIV
jgi:hypothetical protein